tara:strand:+ start:67 stop:282 length:216 start_codon:yes stop_codon:yes gene_type:complete
MNIDSRTKEEPIGFEQDKNEIAEEPIDFEQEILTKREADEVTVDSSAWRSEMKNEDDESQHSEEEQSTRTI